MHKISKKKKTKQKTEEQHQVLSYNYIAQHFGLVKSFLVPLKL